MGNADQDGIGRHALPRDRVHQLVVMHGESREQLDPFEPLSEYQLHRQAGTILGGPLWPRPGESIGVVIERGIVEGVDE